MFRYYNRPRWLFSLRTITFPNSGICTILMSVIFFFIHKDQLVWSTTTIRVVRIVVKLSRHPDRRPAIMFSSFCFKWNYFWNCKNSPVQKNSIKILFPRQFHWWIFCFLNANFFNCFFFLFQAVSCLCHTCQTYKDRLHSCLHCIFFGCYGNGHIQEHAKTKKHFLGKFPLNIRKIKIELKKK